MAGLAWNIAPNPLPEGARGGPVLATGTAACAQQRQLHPALPPYSVIPSPVWGEGEGHGSSCTSQPHTHSRQNHSALPPRSVIPSPLRAEG